MSTTMIKGPYEHTGPYADSELFDTSGTPPRFCAACEHAPCVGGGPEFCGMRPRFIGVVALKREIRGLAVLATDDTPGDPLLLPLLLAVDELAAQAWQQHWSADSALDSLAGIRKQLRQAVS